MGEVVCYAYTSTPEQKVSIDTQIKEVKRFCDYKGLNLVKIYSDCGITDKPELTRMLSELKRGMKVIVYEISRLSRSTKRMIEIVEIIKSKGADLICMNLGIDFSSPTGKMIYTILTSINEMNDELCLDSPGSKI